MSIFDWLKILEWMNAKDKSNLEVFCQERFLKSGETLFKEGDDANAMYFLTKGSISIYKNIKWKKISLGVVNAEEILWEMALFGWKWKRMASAEVIDNVRLVTILSFSIKEITNKYPDLMLKIQNIIKERNMNNKILEDIVSNR